MQGKDCSIARLTSPPPPLSKLRQTPILRLHQWLATGIIFKHFIYVRINIHVHFNALACLDDADSKR